MVRTQITSAVHCSGLLPRFTWEMLWSEGRVAKLGFGAGGSDFISKVGLGYFQPCAQRSRKEELSGASSTISLRAWSKVVQVTKGSISTNWAQGCSSLTLGCFRSDPKSSLKIPFTTASCFTPSWPGFIISRQIDFFFFFFLPKPFISSNKTIHHGALEPTYDPRIFLDTQHVRKRLAAPHDANIWTTER